MTQSPIFVKTETFMRWLLEHTRKFPKHERFRLVQRIDEAIFLFHESLLRMSATHDKIHLQEADIQLNRLRAYLRLSVEMKYTTPKQYEFVAQSLVELGKLLGGWQKS